MIQKIEKVYDEVENNRPPMHAKHLFKNKISIVQKLSNKQNSEVICRFDRLRIAHSKSQTSHMNIGKLIGTHAFDYIVLRVNPGLTSCEDLATALKGYTDLCISHSIHRNIAVVWLESGKV